MEFKALLERFCAAVKAGDGTALAACFAPDGVYHDVFYGSFHGRPAIKDMLENYFHRDGQDFHWEMIEPVSDGRTGYARWLFSYTATLPQANGRRVVMEGCGHFRLRDGLLAFYEDVPRIGEALVQLGLPPDKLHKVLSKMTDRQNRQPGAARHLAV